MNKRRANQTQFVLLGFLESGPMSGYDLKQYIGESVAHFWREGWGQIYPTLKKLEREKLVTRSTVVQKGKPARQVYGITEAGRMHVQKWRSSSISPEIPRNELLLKLFFGSRAKVGPNIDQVHAYRKEQERLQSTYEALEAQLTKTQDRPGIHPQLPFWLITLGYGRRRAAALIDWCDETLTTLGEIERANSKIGRKTEV